jgi:redoxin
LLVDISESRDVVARTVRERGYSAPVVLDAEGEVTGAYGVRATPTTFVIGRDGGIVARAIGPRPWTGPEGRALFKALLEEPAPPAR